MRTWVFFGPSILALVSCAPPAAGPAAPAGAELPRTTIGVPVSRAAPPPAEKTKPWNLPAGSPVDLKIDLTREIAPVTPLHFGNNVAWWDSKEWLRNLTHFEKAARSGIHFWRWPGGSSSDNYHWDNQYGSHTKDHDGNDPRHMNEPWAVSSDDFIWFCKTTRSEAIVTVNYAAARYWDVERAADLAARWVRWFNVEKKFKVRYWEVGNETYGSWEEAHAMPGRPDVTGESYGKDFVVIAKAMKSVDPDIQIGAVAVQHDGGDDWSGFKWWMRDMLPVVGDTADFLIEHDYFVWPFEGDKFVNPSNDRLFENVGKIAEARASIDEMVKKYTRRASPLPVMMTEFHVANGSPPQTIQLISGLFVTEAIGEMIKARFLGSNIWDWKNGIDAKLGGDHGMLATGDSSVPEGTPRPTYYAYALYERAFGERMVEATSSDPNVKVYASRFAGGEPGVIVVNQGTKPVTARIDLGARRARGMAIGWILDGADANAKQVRWNGAPGPAGGGGPFPLDDAAPYMRAYDPARPAALDLPPNSASGIVFY
jgi:hypothetical protein